MPHDPATMEAAKAALTGHSCAVARGDRLYVSDERGIRPLMEWLAHGEKPLEDACAADKVVGKAAALLFVYGGVREIYAAVISEAAAAALDRHGVPYTYARMVPRIINRDGTGLCPMESRVMDTDSPEEAFRRLSEALQSMNRNKKTIL